MLVRKLLLNSFLLTLFANYEWFMRFVRIVFLHCFAILAGSQLLYKSVVSAFMVESFSFLFRFAQTIITHLVCITDVTVAW